MDMPTPTASHRKLAMMAGDWTGPETMHPSPWNPDGYAAVGSLHNRMALDGFALIQDYDHKRDGTTVYQGHAVFGFDPQANQFTLHWFDNMGAGPNVYRGEFNADVLSMISNAHGGQSRCVFDFSKPDTYAFEMSMSQDGRSWKPVMEGRYTKSA